MSPFDSTLETSIRNDLPTFFEKIIMSVTYVKFVKLPYIVKLHKSHNEPVKIISRGSFAVRIEWCHFQLSLSAAFFDFLT